MCIGGRGGCLDALPTHLALHHRLKHISPQCSICGFVEESAFHAIHACSLSQGVARFLMVCLQFGMLGVA